MNDVPLLDDQGNLIGRVNDSHVNARGELVGTAHVDKVGMDILCNVWKTAGCLTDLGVVVTADETRKAINRDWPKDVDAVNVGE